MLLFPRLTTELHAHNFFFFKNLQETDQKNPKFFSKSIWEWFRDYEVETAQLL